MVMAGSKAAELRSASSLPPLATFHHELASTLARVYFETSRRRVSYFDFFDVDAAPAKVPRVRADYTDLTPIAQMMRQ